MLLRMTTETEEMLQRIERLEHLVGILQSELGGATIQRGTGTLVNGTSAAISAVITATSRIVVTKANPLGGAGSATDLAVPTATRVLTTVPGTGSFVVIGVNADNTQNAVDDSTFDWHVIN